MRMLSSIRFLPDKFVLINYSNEPILQQFHGKAIALDVKARRASFTPLFILHEMLVHGFHPFESIEPSMPYDYPWQDWILSCSITRQALSDVIAHQQMKTMATTYPYNHCPNFNLRR